MTTLFNPGTWGYPPGPHGAWLKHLSQSPVQLVYLLGSEQLWTEVIRFSSRAGPWKPATYASLSFLILPPNEKEVGSTRLKEPGSQNDYMEGSLPDTNTSWASHNSDWHPGSHLLPRLTCPETETAVMPLWQQIQKAGMNLEDDLINPVFHLGLFHFVVVQNLT